MTEYTYVGATTMVNNRRRFEVRLTLPEDYDAYITIDELISKFEKYKQEGWEGTGVDYSGGYREVYLYKKEMESDEDYYKRLKEEEEHNKKSKEYRRQQFESLKKEFGE